MLKVINGIILKDTHVKLDQSSDGRTQRVGSRPHDIIVKFLTYRDKELVFNNKRNLKGYNHNPTNDNSILADT